jgi:hypothetical protein
LRLEGLKHHYIQSLKAVGGIRWIDYHKDPVLVTEGEERSSDVRSIAI